MNFEISRTSNEPSTTTNDALYFALLAAVETNRINLGTLNPHNPQSANNMVRNGRIPDQAGTVELPGSRLGAFDLVEGYLSGGELHVLPTSKTAVDRESRQIRQQFGLIILSSVEEGTIRPVAEVADSRRTDWNSSFTRFGSCALRSFGIDASIYDVDEINEGGEIVAKLPKRYF